jgi:uncharacterized protein YjbJ (UPF0337 family)
MKSRPNCIVAIAAGAAILCLSTVVSAETDSSNKTKWAPPNVPGMPEYHEPAAKPESRRPLMNWDTIAGNWKQLAGKVKEKWGKLTDDDITRIDGRREQLEGALQERYGYTKEEVRREVDKWVAPD